MAGEFNAGSVLVELKAQYQDLKKNVQAAKGEMTSFGTRVDATAKSVQTSGQRISNTFTAIDKKSIQLTARIARLTGVMFAAQGAFQSFAGDGQSKGVTAASTGLSAFAAIALAIPHPIGIAIGAVAGLTAGILKFIETAPKGVEAAKEFGQAMAQVAQAHRDLGVDLAFIGRTQTGNQRDLSIIARQRQELEDEIRRRLSAQADTRTKLGRGEISDELAGVNIRDDEQAITLARAKLRDLLRAEGVKDRAVLAEENAKLLQGTAIQLQAGLISPLEAIQIEAQAARRELDALLKDPNTDPTALGLAIDKTKSAQGKVDAQKRLEGLADSFSTSFGSAIERGILSGEKPMEILANAGQSLFENAISEAMKQVQTGLAAAFKAISGGSDLIGGALTAALGIGGALLSRRGNISTESFTGVQSIVESSQAMRGIVAGPGSVAIATVGEDISRSVMPLIDLNRIAVQFLSRIERNTRNGRGTQGAGGSEIVAVPTA
jgi:predicted  nucleic acid-binding Zn-ribbon protein